MAVKSTYKVQLVEGGYEASLTLMPANCDNEGFSFLCFSMSFPLLPDSMQGGVVEEVDGDWHQIRLTDGYDGTAEVTISFTGRGNPTKATDYPFGVYLQSDSGYIPVSLVRPAIRRYETTDAVDADMVAFIPTPQHVKCSGMIRWRGEVGFAGSLWNPGWLGRLFDRLGIQLNVDEQAKWQATAHLQADLDVAFRLDIDEIGACVLYRDAAGFQSAQAYLYQYLLQWAEQQSLPACSLSGSAVYEYRGVHLDVVRHFFAAQSVAEWLDIFTLFQYNHFHWHLTDDDGWRVESQRYPELANFAAWRGAEEKLPPQMGSGSGRYGGFYSADEIKDVVTRAADMGMTVVPEMDLPGHAKAFLRALPELVESEDESVYRSIQNHTDNVVNPCYGGTLDVLKDLIDEWCELFPGPLFHIGGDEVPKGVWAGSPAVAEWSDGQAEPAPAVMGYLMRELEAHLRKNGKRMAGWEEVAEGTGVSSDTWVYSWQGVKAGQHAAAAGYPVVMTPAQRCYLDLSVDDSFSEPGVVWAGTLDLATVYGYQPEEGFDEASIGLIKGVQYCLWSELIETEAHAEYMWFPRLLAGAQVAWGWKGSATLDEARPALQSWNRRLARMGFKVAALK